MTARQEHHIQTVTTPRAKCRWIEDSDGTWQASCGTERDRLFVFNDGGPRQNRFRFCPYCGRRLEQRSHREKA